MWGAARRDSYVRQDRRPSVGFFDGHRSPAMLGRPGKAGDFQGRLSSPDGINRQGIPSLCLDPRGRTTTRGCQAQVSNLRDQLVDDAAVRGCTDPRSTQPIPIGIKSWLTTMTDRRGRIACNPCSFGRNGGSGV